MKYFLKKIYFSIFASLLVIITVATTSYAWYSSNQNIQVSDFTIGISSSDDANMAGLELSIDGINFSDSISEIDMERAILIQKGYDALNLSDEEVESIFSNLHFYNATPDDTSNLNEGFKIINTDQSYSETDGYASFDLYLSISNEKYYVEDGIDIYFQSGGMATGENVSKELMVTMPTHPVFGELPQTITVNPVNAARIGVVVYDTMTKGKPVETSVVSNDIYTFSSNTPSLSDDGVYNFGGINTEYNAMLEYYNLIMASQYGTLSIPNDVSIREDELVYGQQIISSSLGCTTSTMVKVRFYIWLEGWDSDCFNAIIGATSAYSIQLTTKNA